MPDSSAREPHRPAAVYSRVGFTQRLIKHILVYTAEVSLVGRTHRRVILAVSGDVAHQGKPLLYSDVYAGSGKSDPETFVYARHKSSSLDFFAELNGFLEGVVMDNPELRKRKFPVLLSLGRNTTKGELEIPFVLNKDMLKKASFFRLDLPFGAVTAEFGDPVCESGNQLDRMKDGQLIAGLESPLIGVDFTKGDLYKDLLLRVHWASKFIPRAILEEIINDLALTSLLV